MCLSNMVLITVFSFFWILVLFPRYWVLVGTCLELGICLPGKFIDLKGKSFEAKEKALGHSFQLTDWNCTAVR